MSHTLRSFPRQTVFHDDEDRAHFHLVLRLPDLPEQELV
jgi:hypothetical protein